MTTGIYKLFDSQTFPLQHGLTTVLPFFFPQVHSAVHLLPFVSQGQPEDFFPCFR